MVTGRRDAQGLRVICVAGARPNFPKVKPVIDALEQRGVDVIFVHTGQHYDEQLSDILLDELGLRAPDRRLRVGSGTHGAQTARLLESFEPLVAKLQPDVVVVVGDVNSTVGCALVAARAGCLVAHVEAGLRSRDWSMPEEINRVVTDRLSDYLFAPSADAVDVLRREGYGADQIHLVGNVMIDTLLSNLPRCLPRSPALRRRFGIGTGSYGLVTLHRPSNVDDPERLTRLAGALSLLADNLPLVLPAHPRTAGSLRRLRVPLSERVVVTEPLGYLDFVALEADAAVVLTDSGGVQEETTALGVPCLTLRDTTERPITIAEGTNTLVGCDPDTIMRAAHAALESTKAGRRPALWDGKAGERVADVIIGGGRAAGRLRPTALRP